MREKVRGEEGMKLCARHLSVASLELSIALPFALQYGYGPYGSASGIRLST